MPTVDRKRVKHAQRNTEANALANVKTREQRLALDTKRWVSKLEDGTAVYEGGYSVRYLDRFSTLGAAVTAFGSSSIHGILAKAITLTANTTIAATTLLEIQEGGSIALNGFTLTINGPLRAGLFQIFTGSGNVRFGRSMGDLPAEWWGVKADGSDDSAAMLRAIADIQGSYPVSGTTLTDLISSGARLVLPVGTVRTGQVIDCGAKPINIVGYGMSMTTVKPLNGFTGTALFRFGTASGGDYTQQVRLANMNLNLNVAALSAVEIYGVRDGSEFRNLFVTNWQPTASRPVMVVADSGGIINEGVLFDNIQLICGNTMAGTGANPIVLWSMDAANECAIRNSKILGASDSAKAVIGLRIGHTTICKGIVLDNLSCANYNTTTTYAATATSASATVAISDTSQIRAGDFVRVSAQFASLTRAYKVVSLVANTSITLDTAASGSGALNVSPGGCRGVVVDKGDYIWFHNATFENIDGPAIQLGDANTPTNVYGDSLRFYNPGVKTNMQPYIHGSAVNGMEMRCGIHNQDLMCFYMDQNAIHGYVSFQTNQVPPDIPGVYIHASSKIAIDAIGSGYTMRLGPGAGTTSKSTAKQVFDNGAIIEAEVNYLSLYAPSSNKFRARDSSGNTFLEYLANYLKTMKITTGTNAVIDVGGFQARSSNDMADGFGGYLNFEIQDNAGVANGIAGIRWARNGGDTSGDLQLEAVGSGTTRRSLRVNGADGTVDLIHQLTRKMGGVFFQATADKAAASSSSAVSAFSGTATGTQTVPANCWIVGRRVKIKIRGIIRTNGTPNMTTNVKQGSTNLCTSSATAMPSLASDTYFEFDAEIVCRSVGATGTLQVTSVMRFAGVANAITQNNLATFDTTAAGVVDVTFQFSASDANNAWTVKIGEMEMVG